MMTGTVEAGEGESHSLAAQVAMTAVAVGVAMVLVLYLALHGGPAGDEAGRPDVPPVAAPAFRAGPAIARAPADPDVAHLFVVATEGERVALLERLTTENNVRALVGEKPRTAWVAVAADEAEEDSLAAIIADQNTIGGQRVVLVSLRAR